MDRIVDVFREDQSSYRYAKETTDLIKQLVYTKLEKGEVGVKDLWKLLCEFRKRLITSKPLEFSISNIVKRVLSIIRDEAKRLNLKIDDEIVEEENKETKFIKRMSSVLITPKSMDHEKTQVESLDSQKYQEFKDNILAVVDEILNEFENLSTVINESASNHINTNEVVITFGSSYTIQQFLISASKQKNFEVIIVENNLRKNGHKMAEKLAEGGIKCTVVPDTAIYAVMPRVHKAFLSPHSILANGGILGSSGSLLMAMACKAHYVPVIVIGGIYKLTPKISFDQDTFNDLHNPGDFICFDDKDYPENIDVIIPYLDYISPEYLALYITNLGEHTPAYIYRVFSEFYVKD